ncbi:MAG: amidohydrolase family protein [Rhodospirillaceae bacterium]|nr:amidohydrolase family protein [Rhodospirillaceae bacterium]MBT5242153.1 amidohydrolase family protein [Rhodospirillaceae bacterium]MBT5565880.1 amidohydrolase family protein [Rhodospirillaceae bacterium]MBT6088699.1 amidohydrolase family protein [Rhodospirillaceae bacterium]MBT7449408.1 amidohydrolase family protein [Rhodospirillaceae bacterium]
MKSCDTLLRGTVISMDANRTAYLDGYVAVDGGRIVGVGSASECEFEGKETAGGDGHIVIPGLVNVHGHLVQGCIRGMADGTTFEERLFGFYYPMTGACDEERSYISAMPPILDLVRRGVTTTADDHFTHIHKRSIDGVLKAVRDSGMRCRMARLILSDPDNAPDGFREDLDVGLAETERVKAEWENDFTTVTASTIGITYCTPDEFKEIWQWTMDNDRQFDVHAPSVLDTRYLKERRGWEGGSFEWMDHEGILGPNVIAAHAQTLQPGEADLISQCGAHIALVPDMEQVLGLVEFDSRKFLDAGVTCGIGLDGPVVAYGHDLWTALRAFLIAQRLGDQHRKQMSDSDEQWTGYEMLFGSAELALELATIGGAKALNMDDKIGSLEVGKDADIVLIDRRGETQLSPPAALIPNLIYGNGPSPDAVARVMVRGKTLVENGEHVSLDRHDAVRKSDALQETLLDEVDARKFVRMRSPYTWVDG